MASVVVAHGHHDAHAQHGSKSWLNTYIFSTDHKVIGINYMITSLIFFGIAGVLAELMRVNLAQPGSKAFAPETFNQLTTVHGSAMIFLFTIPMLVGGFGNFLMPLMIGAPD